MALRDPSAQTLPPGESEFFEAVSYLGFGIVSVIGTGVAIAMCMVCLLVAGLTAAIGRANSVESERYLPQKG